MIKAVNLLSMIQINSLGEDIFNQFLGLNEINFRAREIQSICYLIDNLNNNDIHRLTINFYDNFYVGYQIPQIGKEFDLLKLGTNYNINIELKSQINEDRIKKQLVKNKFYLNLLEQTVYYITFAYDEENNDFRFYQLDKQDNLILISAENVAELLVNQEVNNDILIDSLFSPSNYLVSPFNSTDRFLNKEYFLTQNQDAIKNNIINIVNQHTNTAPVFISLTGSAGTGKTLLTYDIARSLTQNGKGKKVMIIHCGKINDGIKSLTSPKNNWNIIPIANCKSTKYTVDYIKDNDILIIDEAQRIYKEQFNWIINGIKSLKKICIFAFDGEQMLSNEEIKRDIPKRIGEIENIHEYKLTNKIRTNKELIDFSKGIFNKKENNLRIGNTGNIEIVYFKEKADAVNYIESIESIDTTIECIRNKNVSNKDMWKITSFINYDTVCYYDESNDKEMDEYGRSYDKLRSEKNKSQSNMIIGQEFDNVVVVIDEHFKYNSNGELENDGSGDENRFYKNWLIPEMLYQNITRARRKLKIIIINNPIILQRCLTLLQT